MRKCGATLDKGNRRNNANDHQLNNVYPLPDAEDSNGQLPMEAETHGEITEMIPLIGTIIFWVVANVFGGKGKWHI
jgi:hypothetical protein